MKIYQIKDLLKKEILIVELPEDSYFELFEHGIYFKDHLNADRGFIEGSYALLGKPDEIREEYAKELVESFGRGKLKRFKGYGEKQFEKTAIKSLLSGIETVIFWKNPLGNEPIFFKYGTRKIMNEPKEWERIQAQEKTFDRNRSIILFKN